LFSVSRQLSKLLLFGQCIKSTRLENSIYTIRRTNKISTGFSCKQQTFSKSAGPAWYHGIYHSKYHRVNAPLAATFIFLPQISAVQIFFLDMKAHSRQNRICSSLPIRLIRRAQFLRVAIHIISLSFLSFFYLSRFQLTQKH
jgi:hypothetical protein